MDEVVTRYFGCCDNLGLGSDDSVITIPVNVLSVQEV